MNLFDLFAQVLGEFAPPLASAAVAAAWQGAVLAAILELCLRFIPRLAAARRWMIWGAAFALVATLHLLPILLRYKPLVEPIASFTGWRVGVGWSEALVLVWAALSLGRAVQLATGWRAVHRIVRGAMRVQPDAGSRQLLQASARRVLLCTSAEVSRPSVAGFLRPRILLPPALLAALSVEELHQVLVHELEHLRRRDDWTNLLQKVVLVLFPLNPALLWLERRLCAERELACDERVLAATGAREPYALCLTRIAEFGALGRGAALVLGTLGTRRSELSRRVLHILDRSGANLRPATATLLTAALALGLLGGALGLARSPQWISFGSVPAALAPRAVEGRTGMPPAASLVLARASITQPASIAQPLTQRGPVPVSFLAPRHSRRVVRRAAGSERTAWLLTDLARVPGCRVNQLCGVSSYTVVSTYAAVPVANGWLLIKL